MDTKTIIFWMYPTVSHHYPTFPLAAKLTSMGYEILYAVPKELSDTITANGFDVFIIPKNHIPSFNSNHSQTSKTKKILDQWKYTKEVSRKLLNKDFFSEIIQAHQPELLFIDRFYQSISLQLQRHKVRYFHLDVYVDHRRSSRIPPYNTNFTPSHSRLSSVRVRFLWILRLLRKKATFLAIDYYGLAKKTAKKVKYPLSDLNRQSFDGLRFTEIATIHTSLSHFDFPFKTPGQDAYYYSPVKTPARTENDYDPTFDKYMKEFKLGVKKNIICNFGSLSALYPAMNTFFIKLVSQLRDNDNYNLILSIEDEVLRARLKKKKYNNVFVFKSIPQLYALKEVADVMITHGGINTITECLFSHTPMLVIPVNPRTDQSGNAARVVYHGLGLRSKLKEPGQTIEKKIASLCQEKSYQDSIKGFIDLAVKQSKEDQKRCLDFIQHHIN